MTQKENTGEQRFLNFDPIVLVRDLLKRWTLILMAVLVVGMGAYTYATVTYRPEYRTSITYVTYSRNSATTVYGNLNAATEVAAVFEELLNSSMLRKTILQKSGLSSFDGRITATVIPETNLLTVSVAGRNPRSVFLMAQALVAYHETVTYEVIDNVSLELLQSPTVPMAPVNGSGAVSLAKKAMLAVGAALVALLGFLSLRRDAVRSTREASLKLDCTCLGEVPHERRFRNFRSWLLTWMRRKAV